MSTVYRLRPDEALVFIGLTPPECTYFSYQTFQYYHYYPGEEVFRKTFCNIGDTINFRTIKTKGTDGNPYEKATMIVSTADKKWTRACGMLQQRLELQPGALELRIVRHRTQ